MNTTPNHRADRLTQLAYEISRNGLAADQVMEAAQRTYRAELAEESAAAAFDRLMAELEAGTPAARVAEPATPVQQFKALDRSLEDHLEEAEEEFRQTAAEIGQRLDIHLAGIWLAAGLAAPATFGIPADGSLADELWCRPDVNPADIDQLAEAIYGGTGIDAAVHPRWAHLPELTEEDFAL